MTTELNIKRLEMRRFLPARFSHVLEVGCSEGGFFENLQGADEIWGVEPNQEMAARISYPIKRLLVGTYSAVEDELPDRYFDLVVCNDVIEHMVDPGGFLNAIKKKMAADGYLIGSMPNVRYYRNLYHVLFEKDWRYEKKGIRDNTHLRFFTEKSIRRLIKAHGFQIDQFEGINRSSMASLRKKALFYFLQLSSGVSFEDVKYQQFAFRLTMKPTHDPLM